MDEEDFQTYNLSDPAFSRWDTLRSRVWNSTDPETVSKHL